MSTPAVLTTPAPTTPEVTPTPTTPETPLAIQGIFPVVKAKYARGPIPATAVITVLTANPKKPGSKTWYRFQMYQTGMTVVQALAAGIEMGDVRWDLAHGFISLG
jgi:hypothetical protein